MIDRRLEKILNKFKSIHITSEEKDEVLNRVLSVIEKVDAISIIGDIHHESIKSPFISKVVSYIEYRKFVPAFVIAGLLLLSGGISLAAENALPGDSLYSLKKANEQVLGFAAFSPEAKARLAVEVNARRLQEVATLSAQGKLNNETKGIIQQELSKQADEVKNQVASLVSQNQFDAAQEIAVNYESSLKAHETLLEKVSADQKDQSTTEATHISSLIAVVRDELATSTIARVDLQNKDVLTNGNNAEKAQSRLDDVTAKYQDVQNLNDKDGLVSESSKQSVSDDITNAWASIVKGKEYISKNQYQEAIIVLQQADRLLSDVTYNITAEKNANSDVKKAISNIPNNDSTDTATSTNATSTANSTSTQSSSSTSISTHVDASTTLNTGLGSSSISL